MSVDPAVPAEVQPVVPVLVAGSLQYAPPAKGNQFGRRLAVLAGGVATSIVALVGVHLLDAYQHEDPFAWHLLFLIPVGSILTAVICASGFLFASSLAHVRGGRRLAMAAAAINVLMYVAALYVQFAPHRWVNRHTGAPVGFLQYEHERSMGWTWKSHGQVTPLGAFGYLYRVADVVAFAGIAAFAVSMTRGAAYCDLCQTYPTRKRLALLPASMPYRSLDGMTPEDRDAFQSEQQELARAAVEGGELLLTLAEVGDVTAVRDALVAIQPEQRGARRLPTRVALDIETCPVCRATSLSTSLLVGRTIRHLETRAVSGAFADLISRRPARPGSGE